MNPVQVKFIGDYGGYDVFRSADQYHRNYVRIPVSENWVQWERAVIRGDYVEPAALVENGTVIQVIGRRNAILYEESIHDCYAKSVGKTSVGYEIEIAMKFKEEHRLSSYNIWQQRLLSYIPGNYAGRSDIWLHCHTDRIGTEIIEPVFRLGERLYIVRAKYRHKICGASWSVYYVSNKEAIDCYAICGYDFA